MHRRDAIKKTIILAGGIALTPDLLAKALGDPQPVLSTLPADRLNLLAEMADTIIPDTDTPGAKAAAVQEFIALTVESCFPPEKRTLFWQGLEDAERQCQTVYTRSFVDLENAEREPFLQKLESDEAASAEPGFFTWLKQLTLHGYFTSETGATQALAYDPIPGVWIPDLLVDEDTKSWTPMF